MCKIINFNFNNLEVRTALKNNEAVFCLIDVAKCLKIANQNNVISRLDEKGIHQIDTLTDGGNQKLNFITEPNLYRVIFRSDKAEAKSFQNWVFEIVLPELRKTGKYEITPAVTQDLTTQTPVIQENKPTQQPTDENGFYLYPLTCAAAPSQLRYKIIEGTIYFKLSDIDSILDVSKRDGGDTRTATNYTIHHTLADIGITPYSFDYLLSIWQILELCNHIKSKRSELLENIFCYKVKPFFEKELKRLTA